jgi:hypothetical protein
VAFVHDRSTYFHEADSALGFMELNEPSYITGPASFQRAASHINFLFNWSYVDASHISYYMSGWMPQLRSSLRAAMSVRPQQLHGASCPSDPQPACSDRNTWTYISAIQLPPFPYQNRPTFQQVVTLSRHLPR